MLIIYSSVNGNYCSVIAITSHGIFSHPSIHAYNIYNSIAYKARTIFAEHCMRVASTVTIQLSSDNNNSSSSKHDSRCSCKRVARSIFLFPTWRKKNGQTVELKNSNEWEMGFKCWRQQHDEWNFTIFVCLSLSLFLFFYLVHIFFSRVTFLFSFDWHIHTGELWRRDDDSDTKQHLCKCCSRCFANKVFCMLSQCDWCVIADTLWNHFWLWSTFISLSSSSARFSCAKEKKKTIHELLNK